MRVIVRMAGDTVPACTLQGSQCGCPGMALGTCHTGMFAIQPKIEFIVIEIIAEPIHSIVTLQAVIPKQHLMLHHERHIHSDMTLGTGEHFERCDILTMAIRAGERFFLSRKRVTL